MAVRSLEKPATGQLILDPERLQGSAERHRQTYAQADPSPHIDDARGRKLASKAQTQLGAATRDRRER